MLYCNYNCYVTGGLIMLNNEIINLLHEKIEKIRQKQGRVIIFWIDIKKEYSEIIDEQNITSFKIVKHNKYNQFKIKKILEIDEPETNFIVYRDEEIPENENWLLDIELYSNKFSPDALTLFMEELEVRKSVENIFRKYSKFFDSKERKKIFKNFYNKDMTEKELLYTFFAVIFKAKNTSPYEILRSFIRETLKGRNLYKEIERYRMKEIFFKLIKDEYGVDLEVVKVNDFVEKMLLCHFDYKIKDNSFKEIIDINRNNSYLAMETLLKDDEFKLSIKNILKLTEDRKDINRIIETLQLEELVKVSTFESVDKRIIKKIAEEIEIGNVSAEDILNLIYLRKSESYNFIKYKSEYTMLESALQIIKMIKEIKFDAISSVNIFKNYITKYYKIDTLYRKFYCEYEKLADKEEFENIQEKIEIEYNNSYNRYLSEHWELLLEKEMNNEFKLFGVLSQNNFYEKEIEPFIRKKHRIFVVISDALRYEAGVELAEKLSKEASEKVKIETDVMTSSIPSITKIGMSALLPQNKVEYNNKEITINKISTSGTINREKILKEKAPESIAISYKNIVNMKKEEMSEILKGVYIVYIYHDLIDATGDNYKTEDKVFDAVEKTVEELKNLVISLNKKVGATNIYITADHGFLYQKTQLKEYNKLEKFEFDIIEQGKRYIVSNNDIEDETLIKMDMNYIFKDQKLKAYIPHRNTRIKQQGGGTKFVHGGISLQETVIPLIRFKYMKNEIERKRKVSVELLNTNRIIANNFIKLSFMQSKKVDILNKIFRRKVSVGLYDENEMISDEKILILDSEDDKISSREFEIQLNLKNRKYEFYKKYKLKIFDIEDKELIESYDFDIRFNNF